MAGIVKLKKRNAEATRSRILVAARTEFAHHGLSGARVDEIAARAQANKRMIYHYFGSKENLFRSVLEDAYLDIRRAEKHLDLDNLPPTEALEKLVRFTWDYYVRNPQFITLVNSENLHRGKHVRNISSMPEAMQELIGMVSKLLERGRQNGEFQNHVDPVQLNITIAAIGYYYLTNRFTGSWLFGRDMMDPRALDERIEFNVQTILRLVGAVRNGKQISDRL